MEYVAYANQTAALVAFAGKMIMLAVAGYFAMKYSLRKVRHH